MTKAEFDALKAGDVVVGAVTGWRYRVVRRESAARVLIDSEERGGGVITDPAQFDLAEVAGGA